MKSGRKKIVNQSEKHVTSRTDVYNAAKAVALPFFVCTDIVYRLGHRNVDSNHPEYRRVLRHLHKLKEQKHLQSHNLPEANITIWWFRSRIVDTDNIPY